MNLTSHLTGDQIVEFLAGDRNDTEDLSGAQSHLQSCEACAAELSSLRKSLALFQEASISFADRELSRIDRPAPRVLPMRRPIMHTAWWLAAAAALMAAVFPMELHWQRSLHPTPAVAASTTTHTTESESDAALMADIDRDLSASLPTTMQALADPTGTASTTQTSTATSSQRKD